jgi:hypothetical protein
MLYPPFVENYLVLVDFKVYFVKLCMYFVLHLGKKKPDHLHSGNPAIRLRRTRGFPSPPHDGFGFIRTRINFSIKVLYI